MSALCTDQSKNKNTDKKKKVQCLDVYELFDDCVEHDHFYTRRFLIKDPGFALGVCCLLVTWFWEVPGKVLGGQTLWESSGVGVLPLQAFLEIPHCVRGGGTGRGELGMSLAWGTGVGLGWKGLIPPRFLFPQLWVEAAGMEQRGGDSQGVPTPSVPMPGGICADVALGGHGGLGIVGLRGGQEDLRGLFQPEASWANPSSSALWEELLSLAPASPWDGTALCEGSGCSQSLGCAFFGALWCIACCSFCLWPGHSKCFPLGLGLAALVGCWIRRGGSKLLPLLGEGERCQRGAGCLQLLDKLSFSCPIKCWSWW